MTASTHTRAADLLRALADLLSPAHVSAVARAADLHDGNARKALVALVADGLVERVGPVRRGNEQRPIRITPAGRERLAEIEAGAVQPPPPGTPAARAIRLALHPTHMIPREGPRLDCGRYDDCLTGAALRPEYSGGARCPRGCGWWVAPERVSAVAFTSSGTCNGDAAIYAGAWTT